MSPFAYLLLYCNQLQALGTELGTMCAMSFIGQEGDLNGSQVGMSAFPSSLITVSWTPRFLTTGNDWRSLH